MSDTIHSMLFAVSPSLFLAIAIAFSEISKLESSHNTILSNFKIMAPSKLFRLKNTDDPLLFVPLGNNYFYLVHKWGNDLHPYRKLLMWPFKNLWNMICFLLLLSLGLTYITPTSIFSKVESWSVFWMIYFFMFKTTYESFIS